MKIINEQLLDETQAKALQSPRLRMNYNFHERLDDPINRLLNAMEQDILNFLSRSNSIAYKIFQLDR